MAKSVMQAPLSVIPGSKLKEIVGHSETAEATAYALFLRNRLRTFTDIPRLKFELMKKGLHVVEADYDKLWEELEAAGMGVMVYGRNGKADKFEWHYNMRLVAQAAIEGQNLPVAQKPKEPGEIHSPLLDAMASAVMEERVARRTAYQEAKQSPDFVSPKEKLAARIAKEEAPAKQPKVTATPKMNSIVAAAKAQRTITTQSNTKYKVNVTSSIKKVLVALPNGEITELMVPSTFTEEQVNAMIAKVIAMNS
jgi:hypothetical protein